MAGRVTRTAWLLVLALTLVFLLLGSGWDIDYVLPKRLLRLAAIVLAGVCVTLSSIIFQTLVGNRVLSPAVMGYESAYLLFYSLLLLVLGAQGLPMPERGTGFLVSVLWMLGYSWVVHRCLLVRQRLSLAQLLLTGLVLTMVIDTFTQFALFSASPGEFAVLQGLSYTSFNRVHYLVLLCALPVVLAACVLLYPRVAQLDVLLLGREQAMALGVDHAVCLRRYLALVAVLVAVSTSLVGPTAFLGIFVANLAYALAGTTRHRITLPLGCALAIALFLFAQLLVEHVFNYKTTVSILVNLLCGFYLLLMMVRRRKSA